ncbi:DNA-binding protein [Candidatus Pacearchaeota archaeon]|nr:DNA-binding protein [Candidatus Pacearchaeota archaeon]
MSQNAQLLNYLKQGHSITQKEAVYAFGIYRLSGRIFDLRKLGHNIESKRIDTGTKHFSKYRLIK